MIVIEDRLTAKNAHDWRQQFVLHPECEVEIKGNTAIVRRGEIGCEIVTHGDARAVVEDAQYSSGFMKVQDTRRLSFVGTSAAANVLTTIRMFGDAKAEYSSLTAIDGGFALTRAAAAPTFDRDVKITRQWTVYSGAIKPEDGRFSCTLSHKGGYVMAFNGGFEQQRPSTIGQFPFAPLAVDVSIPLDIETESADQRPKASLFFMQYDETGRRVSNVSVPFEMNRGANTLRGSFEKADGAKGWNIALKLSNLSGQFAIGDATVSFP